MRVKVVVSVSVAIAVVRVLSGIGREIVMLRSVRARSLDVAGLLAAVADTLLRSLRGALAAQVAGLAALGKVSSEVKTRYGRHSQL